MDPISLTLGVALVATYCLPLIAVATDRKRVPAKPCPPPAVTAISPVLPKIPVIAYDDDDDVGSSGPEVALRDVSFDADAVRDEPTALSSFFDLEVAGRSDRGLVRKRNEDAVLMLARESLFVIADGMGGYTGGALASKLAIEAIADTFRRDDFDTTDATRVPPRAAELVSAIGKANSLVRETADREAHLAEMGTTVVAARFCPRKRRVYVSHVGDSRCYRFRDGRLRQITRDHTMATLGVTGQAAGHLSRAVGTSRCVEPDVAVLSAEPGDVFVLCSDGLTKMVAEDMIASVVAYAATPDAAVTRLVALANDHGGKDNVSAIVVRIMPVAA